MLCLPPLHDPNVLDTLSGFDQSTWDQLCRVQSMLISGESIDNEGLSRRRMPCNTTIYYPLLTVALQPPTSVLVEHPAGSRGRTTRTRIPNLGVGPWPWYTP